MSLHMLCKNRIVSVDAQCSIQAAAKVMKENNVGDVIILREGAPVGILTDRDIVVRLAANAVDLDLVTVGNVMSERLLVLNENQEIGEAISSMDKWGVRRAPIVTDSGKAIGVASVDELLILLADELGGLSHLVQNQIH